MTKHNKLVRDKIPMIITHNGDMAETRILNDDQEYLAELSAKLVEEAQEFLTDQNVDELADVLEVVYAAGKQLGYSPQDIEEIRAKKAAARGGFEERIYLISTSKQR